MVLLAVERDVKPQLWPLQWFWDNTLWLKLNGFLILCLGVGLSISVEIVNVISPGFWMVPCGLFVFFSIFFFLGGGGGGGGGLWSIQGFGWFPLLCFSFFFFSLFLAGGDVGAVFTVEYKSNVYVFENTNILSDMLQWFWDNIPWLKFSIQGLGCFPLVCFFFQFFFFFFFFLQGGGGGGGGGGCVDSWA